MVDLINEFEQLTLDKGDEDCYDRLERGFQEKMGIKRLGVWSVRQGKEGEWVLQCNSGSGQVGEQLLPFLPRLMEQNSKCLHLGDRVLFMNDMTLFEMTLAAKSR